MADKPKKKEQPNRSKSGFKIYFDSDTEEWLRKKAREEGFSSAQTRIKEKVRQERLEEKKKSK